MGIGRGLAGDWLGIGWGLAGELLGIGWGLAGDWQGIGRGVAGDWLGIGWGPRCIMQAHADATEFCVAMDITIHLKTLPAAAPTMKE